MNYNEVEKQLVQGLKSFLGNKKAIIGISGGIDSAVIASLCVRAIGKENVIGVQMPYGNQSVKDGTSLVNSLKIKDHVINIMPAVDMTIYSLQTLKNISPLTNGNIRARERMKILYAYAGELGGMVIGTGNKTELMLGYFTKYGDGGCDIEPIGNLYKTEVFELAKYLGDIPDSIINKPPSAELWDGQTDEGEIGMTYAEMDDILRGLDFNNGSYIDIRYGLAKKHGNDKVFAIEKRNVESDHKRNMPNSIEIY